VHGTHKISLSVITEELPPTEPIVKNVMMYDPVNKFPIINCTLSTTTFTQYTTVAIPITIYAVDNKDGMSIILQEDGIEKGRFNNVINGEWRIWNYTPTVSGPHSLLIQCGLAEQSFSIHVEDLDIAVSEVEGAVVRLKASEIIDNEAL
jgi:hypothetical protein